MLGPTLQDFRCAVRSLRSSPATTVVVVLTLALGVGMNTAIFSVVNTVLLRPFEYENPDELMYVNARLETDEIDALISGGSYREIREQVSAFEHVAAVATIRQNLTGVDLAEQVDVGWVSTNLFSLLGVPAWTGRTFREDDPAGTAILSYATWRGALGADPDVSGRTIQLDGRTYTIVGVLPPGFEMHLPRTPSEVDVWKVPDDWWQNGDLWGSQGPAFGMFRLIGRRRDDASVDQVRTELGAIADDLRGRFQEYETSGLALQAVPLRESVVRQIRPTILLLFGAVGFVLLIACANVVNLLLVRAQARKREVALRVALGSSRGRIVRMFLVESLLLAALGGTAGVMLGVLGIDLLEALRPPGVPRIDSVSVDATVFGFALGISLLCTVLFGLLPAWGAARRSVTSDMRQSGASHGRSRQRRSARGPARQPSASSWRPTRGVEATSLSK